MKPSDIHPLVPAHLRKAMMPSEQDIHVALVREAGQLVGRHPELRKLYHPANGGKRTKAEAGIFKAMGVKAGVPDLVLPVARYPFHGLAMEVKDHDGRVSEDQALWREALLEEGWAWALVRSTEHGLKVLLWYLARPTWGRALSDGVCRDDTLLTAQREGILFLEMVQP